MIKAIVIDDEQESRNTVVNILNNFCDNIQVVAQAENVKDGIDKLAKENADVIFLDIQMPDGTGFDLLEKLPEINFQVIFVTAYDQYALKAIKSEEKDNEILELIEEKNRLQEEVKLQQDNQLREL